VVKKEQKAPQKTGFTVRFFQAVAGVLGSAATRNDLKTNSKIFDFQHFKAVFYETVDFFGRLQATLF